MKKYKVVYSERIPSYKETIISSSFGIPYLQEVVRPSELIELEDLCNSIEEAKNLADIKKRVSNHDYFNIRIEEC